MKKRLRKKLRLQEFQELGFHVSFDFANYPLQKSDWQFLDKTAVFAATHGMLQVDGAVNSFYVMAASRQSVTENQRLLLSNWLTQQPEVTNLVVEPLSDAWYVRADEWTDKLPDELLGRPGVLGRPKQ